MRGYISVGRRDDALVVDFSTSPVGVLLCEGVDRVSGFIAVEHLDEAIERVQALTSDGLSQDALYDLLKDIYVNNEL